MGCQGLGQTNSQAEPSFTPSPPGESDPGPLPPSHVLRPQLLGCPVLWVGGLGTGRGWERDETAEREEEKEGVGCNSNCGLWARYSCTI